MKLNSSLFLSIFFFNPFFNLGEHGMLAMQHNSARRCSVEQALVLPLATFAAGGGAIATKLMATITVIMTAMSSNLLEIWIVLTRFRKNLFNMMLWPSASVWVVR